jgi:hypothetical protein
MKRTQKLSWLFAFALLFGSSTQSFSQTLKDVFSSSESPLLYLGVDFTKAKLINYPDPKVMDIRDRIYTSINELTVNEPKKFDFAGAFHKSTINSDLSAVKARNEKMNAEDIVSNNAADFNRLQESDISAVVKALNISGKDGVGLLFVMEAMRKEDKKGDAAMWVTLVDMKTKKVLLTERIEAKATGIGFRNYWASTIKEVIDEIDKKKYKEWKKKFGS